VRSPPEVIDTEAPWALTTSYEVTEIGSELGSESAPEPLSASTLTPVRTVSSSVVKASGSATGGELKIRSLSTRKQRRPPSSFPNSTWPSVASWSAEVQSLVWPSRTHAAQATPMARKTNRAPSATVARRPRRATEATARSKARRIRPHSPSVGIVRTERRSRRIGAPVGVPSTVRRSCSPPEPSVTTTPRWTTCGSEITREANGV
jgi:hypothetical protein